MKTFLILFYYFFFQHVLAAQTSLPADSLKSPPAENSRPISSVSRKADTLENRDTALEKDTLRQDDLQYNPRSPLIEPIIRVSMVSLFNWSKALMLEDAHWAKVGFNSWKRNLRFKLEWDNDGPYTNMFGHPYTGNKYFNVARSNGYTFFQSIPFAVGGSLLWELFGENELPSRNDLLATPLGGIFFGEIFYRLSSNILDDRKRGRNRVYRELFAGVLDPTRALNRITDGKMFRRTSKEVYQKEPLQIAMQTGIQQLNTNRQFATGRTTVFLNVQLEYGNPFEIRKRKPFDFFSVKAEILLLNEGTGHTNIAAHGLLFGKSTNRNNRNLLKGLFQHYDYWDQNNLANLSIIGYGPGLLSRMKLGRNSILNSAFHIALIPISEGRRPTLIKDSAAYKRFRFGGGIKGQVAETMNLNNHVTISLTGSFYKMYSYEETPGTILYTAIKPGIRIKIFKKINLGLEQQLTYFKGKNKNVFQKHAATEQIFFIQADL